MLRYFFYYLMVAYAFTCIFIGTLYFVILPILIKLEILDKDILLFVIRSLSSLYDVSLIFVAAFYYTSHLYHNIIPTLMDDIGAKDDDSIVSCASILYYRDNITTSTRWGILLSYFIGYFSVFYFIFSPGIFVLSLFSGGTDNSILIGSAFLVFGIPFLFAVAANSSINAALLGVMLRLFAWNHTSINKQKTIDSFSDKE